jgi:lipooligosaccharide transport system ATP-binding protein
MEEATALCDRVAIMHQGKILNLDTPRRLITKYVGNDVWEIEVNSDERLRTIKELENRGLDFEEVGSKLQVFHIEDEKSVTGLVNSLGRLQRRQATLEDVFLRFTGRSLAE